MKRKIINKVLGIIVCCGLMLVFSFGLFGCSSNRNDLEKKCKPALDYLSAGLEVQFYQIEELYACNKNIYPENKKYFDEGAVYKITTYRQSGSNVSFSESIFGTLDGEPVLYGLWKSGQWWNLTKVDDFKG